MLMPATVLNNSPDRWFALPIPEDAYNSGCGWLFAKASSSLTDVTGSALLTDR